jgi:hypothetical protein
MYDILSEDIIQNIAEYISVETVIYIFPKRNFKLDPQKYNYSWALCFKDSLVRIRLFLWLIRNNLLPTGSCVLDRLSNIGNVYLIDRLFKIIQTMDPLRIRTDLYYSHRAVDWASSVGNIQVLDWWRETCKQHTLPFRYTTYAIDSASINGHLEVLNWWKNRLTEGVKLLYSRDAMDRTRYINILDWWLNLHHNYDVELKYSTRSMDLCQTIDILNWWLKKHLMFGLKLKYKKTCINQASAIGNVELLNWWLQTSSRHFFIALKYDHSAIDLASQNGHLHVLEWWMKQHINKTGFFFTFTHVAIDTASQNGHLHVLEWWLKQYQRGFCNLKRTVHAVNMASRNGHIHILEWWLHLHLKHKIPLLYNLSALECALDHSETLSWWLKTTTRHRFIFQHINWNQYYSCIE